MLPRYVCPTWTSDSSFDGKGPHFGMPEQPFYAESKQWLTARLKGCLVTLEVLKKDQYGRLVANVYAPPRWCKKIPFLRTWLQTSVSLDMVKQGLAVVYDAGGAVYGGMEQRLRRAQEKAKRKRRGLWSLSKSQLIMPAEWKKKHKK